MQSDIEITYKEGWNWIEWVDDQGQPNLMGPYDSPEQAFERLLDRLVNGPVL